MAIQRWGLAMSEKGKWVLLADALVDKAIALREQRENIADFVASMDSHIHQNDIAESIRALKQEEEACENCPLKIMGKI